MLRRSLLLAPALLPALAPIRVAAQVFAEHELQPRALPGDADEADAQGGDDDPQPPPRGGHGTTGCLDLGARAGTQVGA